MRRPSRSEARERTDLLLEITGDAQQSKIKSRIRIMNGIRSRIKSKSRTCSGCFELAEDFGGEFVLE